MTLLEAIGKADTVPYYGLQAIESDPNLYRFCAHDGTVLGHILPVVVRALAESEGVVKIEENQQTVTIVGINFDARNAAFASLLGQWRAAKRFPVLEGWRNEQHVIYNPSSVPYMLMERAGSALFGVVTYGVHMVGYTRDESLKISGVWVPTRSATKPTFPGMLDNTVAGGVGYPYSLFDTMIKECDEEAGICEEYVRKYAQPAGVVSYLYRKKIDYEQDVGVIQPEVEYIYDMEFTKDTVPAPKDGEVASFELMPVAKVKQLILEGKFKPNCGLVTIDFFIRHGLITSDEEENYLEICQRCHRFLPYPVR